MAKIVVNDLLIIHPFKRVSVQNIIRIPAWALTILQPTYESDTRRKENILEVKFSNDFIFRQVFVHARERSLLCFWTLTVDNIKCMLDEQLNLRLRNKYKNNNK